MRSDEVTGILREMKELQTACDNAKGLDLSQSMCLSGSQTVMLTSETTGESKTTLRTLSVALSKSQAKIMVRTCFNASARRFNQLAASINCEDRIELWQGKETTDDGDETE